MNRAWLLATVGSVVACGASATVGTDLYVEDPPDIPPKVTVIGDGSTDTQDDTDRSKVAPDTGTDVTLLADSGEEAGEEAGEDSGADASDDASDAMADADAPDPVCQVRGSCQYGVTFCDEYEDTGAFLATQKANCLSNAAYVWSDGPCTRVNKVGVCNTKVALDIDCPKYREVYYPPATLGAAQNKCNTIGGTFEP